MAFPKKNFIYITVIIWIIAFINFFSFMAVTSSLGGDALNGFEKNGRYYVSEHGKYTEVDKDVWQRNRIHGISMIFTHSAALICGFIEGKRIKKMFNNNA